MRTLMTWLAFSLLLMLGACQNQPAPYGPYGQERQMGVSPPYPQQAYSPQQGPARQLPVMQGLPCYTHGRSKPELAPPNDLGDTPEGCSPSLFQPPLVAMLKYCVQNHLQLGEGQCQNPNSEPSPVSDEAPAASARIPYAQAKLQLRDGQHYPCDPANGDLVPGSTQTCTNHMQRIQCCITQQDRWRSTPQGGKEPDRWSSAPPPPEEPQQQPPAPPKAQRPPMPQRPAPPALERPVASRQPPIERRYLNAPPGNCPQDLHISGNNNHVYCAGGAITVSPTRTFVPEPVDRGTAPSNAAAQPSVQERNEPPVKLLKMHDAGDRSFSF